VVARAARHAVVRGRDARPLPIARRERDGPDQRGLPGRLRGRAGSGRPQRRAGGDHWNAGLSIEDSTGDPARPLFDFPLAVERIRAARHAIDASGTGVLLTGRSEGFIAGRPNLDETIRRLVAYAEAGADCLYAPGIRAREEVAAVVKAVAPRPVNALVYGDLTTVAEMAEAGARRISVGGALARAAWTGFLQAAREIAEHGTFSKLAGNVTGAEMEKPVDPR
jgi:2-methylisocitrate lyase-like PEP mutase family enzyme